MQGHTTSELGKTTQKLAFFSMSACQKLLSTFNNFLQHCIFQSKAKFDAHKLYFKSTIILV
jgi:hypothetical protein